jgi:hypothetical protein
MTSIFAKILCQYKYSLKAFRKKWHITDLKFINIATEQPQNVCDSNGGCTQFGFHCNVTPIETILFESHHQMKPQQVQPLMHLQAFLLRHFAIISTAQKLSE